MEDPGQKTKRIQLKAVTEVNTSGSLSKTKTTFDTVWASFRPLRMSERFTSDAKHSVRVGNFRIYHRDDVTPTTVIGYDGRDWDVIGIAEVGEREELEITAEAVY